MTRKELAEVSGIPETTIKKYEADEFQPKPEQKEKLAKALNVSADEVNTENFWRNADGKIEVQIPDFLNENFDFLSYHKKKKKTQNLVIKQIRKHDFQSDLIVDIVDMLLSMNPEGQGDVYHYVCDRVTFPKYQKKPLPLNEDEKD
jgi:transcriptional regulator with XRE-family HTH domain